jgi:hypothetical protein
MSRRFTLILILLWGVCFGQVRIEGFVFDARTYEPIEGVEITIKFSSGKRFVSEERTTTDKRGYYIVRFDSSFDLKDLGALITARKRGYHDFKKGIDIGVKNLKFDIYLSPLEYHLDTVTVEAKETFLASMATYRLRAVDLHNVPTIVETDVLRGAWFLPGVIGVNDLTSKFSIRGGDPNYNIVMMDGVRILNPYHFGGLVSAINPDIVGSVNLYTGAYPLYYYGTLSGILDVSTKELDTSKFSLNGSLSLLTTRIGVNLPISSFGFISGFRRTYYDIFGFPYYFYDFHLKTFYDLGKSSFRYFVYFSRDVYDILKWEKFTEWKRRVRDEPLTWGNSIHGLRWIYTDKGVKSEVLFYFTSFSTRTDVQIDWLNRKSKIVERVEIINVGNKIANYGLKFNFYFRGEAIDIYSSFNFDMMNLRYAWDINSEVLSGIVSPPQEVFFDFAPTIYDYIWKNWSAGGFLNFKFKTGYRFNIDLGFRGDYLKWLNRTILTPYIRVDYLYKWFAIFMAFKRNFQMFVQFGERFRGELYSEFKLPFPSEGDAYPYSTDLSFGVESNDPAGKLNIKCELYWQKRLRLPYISEIDLEKKFYGESSYGVDVFVRFAFSGFNSIISYSFNRVIRAQEGARFPGNFDLMHSLKILAVVKLTQKVDISFSWVFNSGLPYSKRYLLGMPTRGYPPYLEYESIYIYLNNFREQNHHRLDVTLKSKFNIKVYGKDLKIEPFLTVINLYARKNRTLIGYDERTYEEEYFDGFPFSAVVGFNFNF